ncbi:helix-turn-helix domain-containing protein [Cyclobacterium xiamenense]|uniref:helix-turn-helix domain-containing protein n=1 Tax=Cyclobacterium xiamenense TaxID=1297121 RepID=UPI0012B8DC28|nr:AraC family transcriptional regulator [Cyclobacterium xiamenense]
MKHRKKLIIVPESTSFNLKRAVMTPRTYRIHSHKNFELNYIVDGWGNRIVGNTMESFSRGDLVLMGPDLPHCWEVTGVSIGCLPECITIHFHEDFFGQKIKRLPELSPILDLFKLAKRGVQFYGRGIEEIRWILQKIPEVNNFRKLIYLLEIFDLLIRTDNRRLLVNEGFIQDADDTNNLKLKRVYEYILVNFSKKIRLEDVADHCHLSVSAFCRFFESNTGKSLFNYLKEVRIGYASKLLMDSDLLISDICYQSGYTNLSHFNNQFKQISGVTPSQYRKTVKQLS